MPPSVTILEQNEIPGEPSCAMVRGYSLETVGEMKVDFFDAALFKDAPCVAGVSLALASTSPQIRTLALATRDNVFSLTLHRPPSLSQKRILREIFSNITYLTGFELPYTIILLAHSLGCDISGLDLSIIELAFDKSYIKTPGTLIKSTIHSASAQRIDKRWENSASCNRTKSTNILEPSCPLRAWFTAIAANAITQKLRGIQPLNTKFLNRAMLRCLVDFSTRSIRLELLKPLVQENEFASVQTNEKGRLVIENARFKSRIRKNKHTQVELHLKNGGVIGAMPERARGRRTFTNPTRPFARTDDVSHIQVIGREDRNSAENARYQFLVLALRSPRYRDEPFFAKALWFPKKLRPQSGDCDAESSLLQASHLERLNESQREVATAMVSPSRSDSLVIVHGPPGTGKTTTIAAAAATWVDRGVPCWIIAQSNVGVKNIAQTLVKRRVKFKLLVSKEFIFEWHEELYDEVKGVIIRSDELKNCVSPEEMFDGITLVLSTLSMLSNPMLDYLFRLIPVRSLVVDEASQVDVLEFMHLFFKFSRVLEKVCFFGDPKQLPPYGAREASLQTIFEVNHLRKTSYFLNTQYRFPMPLGGFISENVYEGKLRSCHNIVDHSCVVFIDTEKGREEEQGKSYKNTEEVHMVVRVAKRYHQRKMKFCIITFYDSQRAAITKALEIEKLPPGCVYNVDSFQGNEADYVILSSVRTQQPGFLQSLPRMNVALTRCQKGMVVITNKRFLQGPGKSTLLGKLCRFWCQHGEAWLDWRAVLGTDIDLPGMSA